MIIFDLRCANGHGFEGWFDNSEDLESQLACGRIACPHCDDVQVERVPSPVTIKKKLSSTREWERALRAWRKVCGYINENFEDVGHNFAREALKLHYGQAEERNIRGITTEVEEDLLEKEGVPFVKIPMPQQLDS